ncbi:MAG: TetR/AcrR family transcriptional regulator [bacterium]|nr:TetR/AcrR family transcriptional regulator [bacterium]
MARRKKEPQNVHRKNISAAAEQLFMEKGIERTSMNEIAQAAGYSKATLYVYFKNKEEIISFLVLESMKTLHEYLSEALHPLNDAKTGFLAMCHAVLRYQEEYPLYFKMVLDNINIDFESRDFLPEEKETFLVGEAINQLIASYFQSKMESGELRPDIPIVPTLFTCWGMISGTIQLATNKEAYIYQQMGLSKEAFLMIGFETLYRSLSV